MKVIKKINVNGGVATLFANGDIAFAGMLFVGGMGCNSSVIKALGI